MLHPSAKVYESKIFSSVLAPYNDKKHIKKFCDTNIGAIPMFTLGSQTITTLENIGIV